MVEPRLPTTDPFPPRTGAGGGARATASNNNQCIIYIKPDFKNWIQCQDYVKIKSLKTQN